MKRLIFLLGMGLFLFSGFVMLEGDRPERPIENWVFTANLDGRPNVLVVALHKQLWVAYDRANCQLIKAWRGGVKIEDKGTSVISNGLVFYQEDPEESRGWSVRQAGKTIIPESKMGNVSLADDSLTLEYDLILPDGHKIWIREVPEVILKNKNENRCGLERKLQVGNMPLNAELAIPIKYRDMYKKKDIRSNQKVRTLSHQKKLYEFGTAHDMEVEAILDPVEETLIKMMFTFSLEQQFSPR